MITILLVAVLFVGGCTQEKNQIGNPAETQHLSCSSTCDDKKPCTKDFCSDETKFKCMHEDIIPCCGNNKCEEGESSLNCNDCPKMKNTKLKPPGLVLNLNDLPPNYTMVEEKPILKSEMENADIPQVSLKWEEGYIASFMKRENLDIFAIGQRIYIYSSADDLKEVDFSDGFTFLKEENPSSTYEEIPCDIGDECISWKIISSINDKGDKTIIYALQFSKMNVYEDIFVFDLDHDLLVDLAKKAEAKIK
ncbi:MAG: hypothetical protein KAQ92_04595 [Candidatus Aenigmarchaeota archaeon]|nr:hypothetical protein [Candidatus Aenigmarchaeota archaeon]